jgi:ankyrin repeat protein
MVCVDGSNDSDGWNVHHFAASGGSRECISWVLDNTSIDVNSVDNKGRTSIMNAVYGGDVEAAKCLAERGATY